MLRTVGLAATSSGVPRATTLPQSMTMIRWASSRMTASTCSTTMRATPSACTLRTISIICSVSCATSPAPTSSRNSTRGCNESARAISRRLRSSRPRLPAGRCALSFRPQRSSTSTSRIRSPRASAPTRTFSATVSRRNGRGTWLASATPDRATWWVGQPRVERPSSRMSPESGRISPSSVLSSVLFPAPLGPITPMTSPGSIERSSPSRAVTPPKRFVSPRASSSGIGQPTTTSASRDERRRRSTASRPWVGQASYT